MANTFSPFGFRPFGRQEGGAPTAGMTKLNLLSSDTNTYFTGDVVTISSQSLVAGYITAPASGTTTGSPIQGIFAGCEYYSPTVARMVWSPYFPASVGSSSPCNAYVITDPEQLFTVQCTTTAVVGTSAIGLNVGYASSLQSGGNTLTGISAVALNSSTVSGNSSLPFRIVDTTSNFAPPGVNGTDGSTTGAILVVQMNNAARRSLTAVST
jgi:hypothetical protein